LESAIIQENAPQLTLPKCKNEQLIFFNQIVKSPNELCSWLQFSNVCSVQISIADVDALFNKGKNIPYQKNDK